MKYEMRGLDLNNTNIKWCYQRFAPARKGIPPCASKFEKNEFKNLLPKGD